MFEKLVVSTSQKRRSRTAKFFLCTSLTYVIAFAIAVALSVLLVEPKLADTGDLKIIFPIPAPPSLAPPPTVVPPGPHHEETPESNPKSFMKLDDILSSKHNAPPRLNLPKAWEGSGGDNGSIGGNEEGVAGSVGVGPAGGDGRIAEPPPRPQDPPKPQPRPDNQNPVRMSSTVLQGKAIERVVPVYPELVRRIRLQGDVSVEVIISPEGRVESARAVSGHPMLVGVAVDAARRWRFEPTFLNKVPVRVTGVIVFVFKLDE
jgi:protein TonB